MTKLEIVKNPELVAACLSELSDTILTMQECGIAKGRFAPEPPNWLFEKNKLARDNKILGKNNG